MACKILVKVKSFGNIQRGTSNNGNSWSKQDFICTTDGNYPRDVCFTAFNDKVDVIASLNIGESVDVHFDPESREYNGRWYTDLKFWKFERVGTSQKPSEEINNTPSNDNDWMPQQSSDNQSDYLPF